MTTLAWWQIIAVGLVGWTVMSVLFLLVWAYALARRDKAVKAAELKGR